MARLNIKKAIKRPGALTRKAKAAGMSVQAFAAKVRANPENFSKLTGQQARFAKTLKSITDKRRK